MSERVMSGKVAFLPSQVEPQTPYVALLLALYDPLFQSIKNCATSRATIYVQSAESFIGRGSASFG
jgi:hypothetical protein